MKRDMEKQTFIKLKNGYVKYDENNTNRITIHIPSKSRYSIGDHMSISLKEAYKVHKELGEILEAIENLDK